MAKPRGKNPTKPGRAEPRAAKTADTDTETRRIGRPSAKDAAAKAVAKPPGKPGAKPPAKPAAKSPAKPAAKDATKPAVKPADKATERKPPSAAKGKPAPTKRTTPPQSPRYTPPIPRSQKVSPLWVPIVMFACLGVGMAIIILNYVNVLPGPDPSNVYLMIGLALITVGFVTATKYH